MKNQKGFTLIELMIVVAIIGILASVAVPQYQDYVARSKVTDPITQASGIKLMMADFYSDFSIMPKAGAGEQGEIEVAAAIAGMDASAYATGTTYTRTSDDIAFFTTTFEAAGTNVTGKTMIFSFDGTGPTFKLDCTGGDLAAKFRSSACR